MKNIITIAFLLTIISFTSCKKKTTAPETGSTTVTEDKTIKVQYRVSAPSGQMSVKYTFNEGGVVKTIKQTVNRLTYSFSFEWSKGEMLSLHASNVVASTKAVTVEIYVNGALFKSGRTDEEAGVASAEGIYN